MRVEPHLCFEGRCEEALEFYRRALGAEVQIMMRFRDMPGPSSAGGAPPGCENKVMHATIRIGDTKTMASDGNCTGKPDFKGIDLALQVRDLIAAERLFTALAEGGQVRIPLAKTFWSPGFAMVTDRFGVGWMINVESEG